MKKKEVEGLLFIAIHCALVHYTQRAAFCNLHLGKPLYTKRQRKKGSSIERIELNDQKNMIKILRIYTLYDTQKKCKIWPAFHTALTPTAGMSLLCWWLVVLFRAIEYCC